jgi:hypothetical protein
MEDQTLPKNILLEHILTLPLGMRCLLSDTSTICSSTPPIPAPRPSPPPLEQKPLCLVLDLTLVHGSLQKLQKPSELCPSTPPLHSRQSPLPTSPTTPEEGHYEVSIPKQNVVGYEDCSSVASGAAAPRQEALGPEEPMASHHRSHSVRLLPR